MAQILTPASDQATGSWTSTPLWSKVDDDSTVNASGDGTTITSSNNSSPDQADFALATGTDPQSTSGHVLRARWNKDSTGGHQIDPELELWQGVPGTGSLVASLAVTDIGATETESTYTLNGTEAGNITDYSDLYLRLERVGDTGGNPSTRRSLVVDLVELEIPDAPAGTDELVGSSTAVFLAAGALSQTHLLAAANTATARATGTLSQVHGLVGQSQSAISGSGSLVQLHRLAASASEAFNASGVLTQTQRLLGSSTLVSKASAALDAMSSIVELAGAAVVISRASAEIDALALLVGSSVVVFDASGAVKQEHHLSGTSVSVVEATARLYLGSVNGKKTWNGYAVMDRRRDRLIYRRRR